MPFYNVQKTKALIQSEEVIQDWLEGLSPNSKKEYLILIAEFSQVNNLTPTQMLKIAYEERENRLPPWELSIKDWFKAYEDHCMKYQRSKTTRDHRTTILKSFFRFYGIDLPQEHSKRRENKKKYPVKNKRKGLTREQIHEALENVKSTRLKAMILTQCSSGIALSDLINLKLEQYKSGLFDVTENKKIGLLQFKEGRQKTEKPFYTFISWEAVEAIERYIIADRYKKGNTPYLFTHFYQDKQVREDSVLKELRHLNEKLGLKHEKGYFRQITSHLFRKYFNTQLTNAGMPYEVRKHLLGHIVPSKVDSAYYLDNMEEIRKIYLKYIDHLLIYQTDVVHVDHTDEKVTKLEGKYNKSEKLREEERKRHLEKEKEWEEYKLKKEKESEEFKEFMEHVKHNKEI